MSREHVTITDQPGLQDSTLLVMWSQDVGTVSHIAHDYLTRQLGCVAFAEIEPIEFFPLNGVTVQNDVAIFPQSMFSYSKSANLALFLSETPAWQWHTFLNAVLDVAIEQCKVKQVLTLGGMGSIIAHTFSRQVMASSNSQQLLRNLGRFNVEGVEYTGTPMNRPTLSSYLVWAAKKRDIAAASLWAGVPFYLSAGQDPRASLKLVMLLNDLLELGADTAELAGKAESLDKMLADARVRNSEIDQYLNKLETHAPLTPEESEKLAGEVNQALRWG